MKVKSPISVSELKTRSQAIANKTVEQLANSLNVTIPDNLKLTKGYIGQLLELILGADAGQLPIPDFTNIGVELKSIPVTKDFEVIETTYVCTAPIPVRDKIWEESTVKKKLSHVLWVPYILEKENITKCKILNPVFWKPNQEEEETLKQDWEELTDLMAFGEFAQISSHIGEALQLRPKAANSKQVVRVLDIDGNIVNIVPKGFYLRRQFTQTII